LLERNAQQQAANRQGTLVKAQAEQAAAEGAEQQRQRRIAAGLDPATGRPLPSAGSTSRLTRIDQEPAAFRKGGHVIFLAPSGPPTTTGTYPLPDSWTDIFPSDTLPSRWWIPTRQLGFVPKVAFLEPGTQYSGDPYVTYDPAEQCLRANNSLLASFFDTGIFGRSIGHYSLAGSVTDSIRSKKTITIEAEIYMPAIPNVIYNGNSSSASIRLVLISTTPDTLGSLAINIVSTGNIAIGNTGPNAGIDQGGYFYRVSLQPVSANFTPVTVNYSPGSWMPIKVTINGGSLAQDQAATDASLILEVQGTTYTYSFNDTNLNFVRPLFIGQRHSFQISGSAGQSRAGTNPYSPVPGDWKARNIRFEYK
jgi:hypothetical protein